MSAPGGGSEELQQLSAQIRALQEQQQALQAELEGLQARKTEIDEAVSALETLETGSVVQVPLGGGAFVRAEVQDVDETVVNLGGGYAAERDRDGAVESLARKKDVVDDRIDEVRDEMRELEAESEQLEQRAARMQQQLQTQLGAGAGAGAGGGDDE